MPTFAAFLLCVALPGQAGASTPGRSAGDLVATAAVHADAARVDEALRVAAEAERLATASRDHRALSGIERVRAVVARQRGEQLAGIAHGERAAEHARKAGDPSALSLALTQVASGYQQMGDWSRALDYAHRAYEAHPAPNDGVRLAYLMQRGIVLHELREGPESLAAHREALAIARRIGHHRTIGFALMEIGLTTWLVEGRPAEALPYFEESIQWTRRAGATTLEPAIFTNWGGALRDLGRYDEAIVKFKEGLAVRPGGLPNSAAPVLTKNLGQTLALAGRPAEAEPRLLEAVTLADRMNGGHARWQARLELGLLLAPSDPARADRYFAEAIAVLEEQSSNALLERFRAGLFGSWFNKYDPFDRYIDFLLDQRQDARVFDVIEKARARAFLDTLSVAREQLARVIPADFVARERELLDDITRRQAALRSPDLDRTAREDHARQVAAAEERLSAIRLRLAADYPALAQTRYPRLWDTAAIQDVLAPGEYLLVFYLGQRQTTCVVISSDAQRVVRLPDRGELESLVRRYLEALKSPASDVPRAARPLNEALAPALHPLPDNARLIVVPHGILSYVPFEALPTTAGGYLGERHSISYAPSASSLAFLRQVPAATGRGLLAVGNPPARTAEATAERSSTWQRAAYLKPLAWAGHELRQVASTFGPGARVLQGREATESALERAGIQRAQVIHFATHGLIDEQKPERSALALAPRPPFDDGMLQVREIYRWRLNATLVTLSACETALGREVTGEGLVGLSRAFFAAGATAVASSLWNVNDAGAAAFMRHFYASLRSGERIDDAAREARRALRAEGERYAHPYYWAPFVVSGDASRRIDSSLRPAMATRPFYWLGAAMTLAFVALIVTGRRG